MKLSTRARYALRMMLEIAKHGNGECVSLGEISNRTDISRRYLDQLATAMKNAALLRGRAGRSGGYELAKPADDIPLSAIIEAGIGPINIVECVQQPESCDKADKCECRSIYSMINHRIIEVLETITLAELADHDKLPGIMQDLG